MEKNSLEEFKASNGGDLIIDFKSGKRYTIDDFVKEANGQIEVDWDLMYKTGRFTNEYQPLVGKIHQHLHLKGLLSLGKPQVGDYIVGSGISIDCKFYGNGPYHVRRRKDAMQIAKSRTKYLGGEERVFRFLK